jgi:hypothetical protein
VKVAWLVRRAVERFLEEAAGGPLLPLDLNGGVRISLMVSGDFTRW